MLTTSADDEPKPLPGGTSENIVTSTPRTAGIASSTAWGSAKRPSQPPVVLRLTSSRSSERMVMPSAPVGFSMQRTYLSIVQLSTLPPCSSAYGLTSVPPPKNPIRIGALALYMRITFLCPSICCRVLHVVALVH